MQKIRTVLNIKYIKCLFIHTMCKCDVSCIISLMYSRILFVLISSLSNLILILKLHKLILAPQLGESSTRPKHSSSYSCILEFLL
jgi:hypothetical protein